MTPVGPLRVTPEDLPDLDKKTRNGLAPLLEAINVFAQQVVAATGATPDAVVPVTLVTGGAVADSFPLLFRSPIKRPTYVGMTCTPRNPDHVLTTPFVAQGFSLTNNGFISIPSITGLFIDQTYDLAFLVR